MHTQKSCFERALRSQIFRIRFLGGSRSKMPFLRVSKAWFERALRSQRVKSGFQSGKGQNRDPKRLSERDSFLCEQALYFSNIQNILVADRDLPSCISSKDDLASGWRRRLLGVKITSWEGNNKKQKNSDNWKAHESFLCYAHFYSKVIHIKWFWLNHIIIYCFCITAVKSMRFKKSFRRYIKTNMMSKSVAQRLTAPRWLPYTLPLTVWLNGEWTDSMGKQTDLKIWTVAVDPGPCSRVRCIHPELPTCHFQKKYYWA